MFKKLKDSLPTFSGNVNDYTVNYLLELDLLKRITHECTVRIDMRGK